MAEELEDDAIEDGDDGDDEDAEEPMTPAEEAASDLADALGNLADTIIDMIDDGSVENLLRKRPKGIKRVEAVTATVRAADGALKSGLAGFALKKFLK